MLDVKTKNSVWIIRQGDVLVERIPSLPKNIKPIARENGRVVLAHGEVTGHCHAISSKAATHYQVDGDNNATFLEIAEAMADLVHDEHATIQIPAGCYRVIRQREYSPEEIRRVAD